MPGVSASRRPSIALPILSVLALIPAVFLTSREQEVLLLIARGYTYKEIAAKLVVSTKTVESTSQTCCANSSFPTATSSPAGPRRAA